MVILNHLTSTRSHNLGVDKNGKSFTQLLSQQMADQIVSFVQQHMSKYSIDQIFTVLKDWIPKQIKNPTVTESIEI